ncbi:MAG: hypothetical protein KC731_29410, partial [Myxococcales bacterium]|nr:hypothetical protein [Myxococcales bacterium]
MNLDRLATFGVPVAAGLVTAAVLLGPAAERPVSLVTVRGRLAAGARGCAFRLETRRHFGGIFEAAPMRGLTVELRHLDQILCTWSGDTTEAPVETMARLVRPLDDGETLEVVVHRDRRVLAQQPLTIGPAAQRLAPVAWRAEGPEPFVIEVPRGQLVPEEAEPVHFDVEGPREAPPPDLTVEVTGGEVSPLLDRRRGACEGDRCRYLLRYDVIARAPALRLRASRKDDAAAGHWEGDLPLVPGGLWFDEGAFSESRIEVRAAFPIDEVFLSVHDPHERLWGGRIAMAVDEQGRSRGKLATPIRPGAEPQVVTLSNDASEPSGSCTTWPLDAQGRLAVSLQVLAETGPAALEAEEARQRRARLPAFGLVMAAGLFELLYLLYRRRQAGAELG